MIKNLFPIFDHLYIFQAFEYEPIDFLRWFFNHPLERSLQKKHHLKLTSKALALLLIASVLEFAESLYLSNLVLHTYIFFPIFFLLIQLIGPIYIIIAWALFLPFELYLKNKILSAAREKLKTLPKLKVVAITGSFGKTSTKDTLYTLLWKDFRVVKTPKSFNTPISIARTILNDLKTNTEIFLVEMDAYHPGEIKKLAEMVNPDIGIITAIAPQHLGRFGTMEKLAKTQFELAEILTNKGILVLNSTNEWIMRLENQYKLKKVFYGEKTRIKLPLLGTHHVQNFLAASAVAQILGLSLKRISQRAQFILPTPHRLEIKKQGSLTIIDNTYNTNPLASKASLKLLKDLKGSQKILITPGLVELGQEHSKENQEFASIASKVADKIVIVGQNAKKDLLLGLKEKKYPTRHIYLAKTTNEALSLLPQFNKPNTVVLLENDLPDQYF